MNFTISCSLVLPNRLGEKTELDFGKSTHVREVKIVTPPASYFSDMEEENDNT